MALMQDVPIVASLLEESRCLKWRFYSRMTQVKIQKRWDEEEEEIRMRKGGDDGMFHPG